MAGGVWCPVSGGRCPVSGGGDRWPVFVPVSVRWPVAGVRGPVSGVWPVCGVWCPVSGGRWPGAGAAELQLGDRSTATTTTTTAAAATTTTTMTSKMTTTSPVTNILACARVPWSSNMNKYSCRYGLGMDALVIGCSPT